MSNKRNQNTRHERKSRRREGALYRLPALLAVPEMPVEPVLPKRGGKGKKMAVDADTPATLLQRSRHADAMADYTLTCARVAPHNARVTAERATLEARIGKPPRAWPKRALKIETPHAAHPRDMGFDSDTADDMSASWDEYMGVYPTTDDSLPHA